MVTSLQKSFVTILYKIWINRVLKDNNRMKHFIELCTSMELFVDDIKYNTYKKH